MVIGAKATRLRYCRKQNSSSQIFYKHAEVCQKLPRDVVNSDIDMVDVYNKLSFETAKSEEWQQSFPLKTSNAEWIGKKLKGNYQIGILFNTST